MFNLANIRKVQYIQQQINYVNGDDHQKVIKYTIFPPPAPIRAQMVFTDFEQLHQRTTKKNISHVDIRQNICEMILLKMFCQGLLLLFTLHYCRIHLRIHYPARFSQCNSTAVPDWTADNIILHSYTLPNPVFFSG